MKYNKVPNIISSKDLDYLSDMFNINYCAFKCSCNASNFVIDSEIKEILENSKDTFYGIMNEILNIIGGMNE